MFEPCVQTTAGNKLNGYSFIKKTYTLQRVIFHFACQPTFITFGINRLILICHFITLLQVILSHFNISRHWNSASSEGIKFTWNFDSSYFSRKKYDDHILSFDILQAFSKYYIVWTNSFLNLSSNTTFSEAFRHIQRITK